MLEVVVNISGTVPFHEISKHLNYAAIPESPHDDEHIRYVLPELINNAVRAHREMNLDEVITTEPWVEDDRLKISIVDKGGGFDMRQLPCDFSIPDETSGLDSLSVSGELRWIKTTAPTSSRVCALCPSAAIRRPKPIIKLAAQYGRG